MCAKLIGAGILAIDKQTGRILMCRRGMKTDSPNCWSFFGGTFELKDGIPRNTTIREFKEESGCAVEYLLSKKPFYVNNDNHLRFYTYIGLFHNKFPIKLNSENLDFEWFSIDHLPDNLHPGVKEMIDDKKNDIKSFIQAHCS